MVWCEARDPSGIMPLGDRRGIVGVVMKVVHLIASAICALLVEPAFALNDDQAIDHAPSAITFQSLKTVARTEYVEEGELTFPSAWGTQYPENDQVKLHVFLPTDRMGSVPVVVALHYWGATDLALEREMAEQLAENGMATVVMPLPYHLSRTPKGTRSGELAVRADVQALRSMMIQSVLDVRRTLDWIDSRDEFKKGSVGIVGTSLGALVASTSFGIDKRFGSGAFLLGGADFAHLIWKSSRVVLQREELRREGFTEDRLRTELQPIEPLTYIKLDGRKSLVVAGRYDTIVPQACTDKLIAALGKPETVWLDTGHYGGMFVQRRLVQLVARFFRSVFENEDFVAPKSFYAPTIRLGLQWNPETGTQVAAGLDVWRSNATAESFGTIMATPRGMQGFLGHRIGRDFAFGVSVLPKKTTFGVFWSVVL